MRAKKISHPSSNPPVPRPHSADFLEYESKVFPYDDNCIDRYTTQAPRQPPRPKSSLDINYGNEYNDSYYYSEASYAEKMRQSAHYLRNKAAKSIANQRRPPDGYPNQRKLSMPSMLNHDNNFESDPIYGDLNRNTENYHSEVTGPNSNWTLKNKSLSQVMAEEDSYNRSNSALSDGSVASGLQNLLGDQFMRSASARLPSIAGDGAPREGEKKVQQVIYHIYRFKIIEYIF